MTIRQQYANEEMVHKLRSMLNDLPTLRTRAIKKLEQWREAAIKRLLIRQRELEKTLLDKFERLEFDTQLFVEKTERKKAQQQRRWQSEPLDYLNKNEIDRISTNLRSIREELEQSKLILDGNINTEFLSNSQLTETALHKSSTSTSNDLGLELKRVLEICTSPQSSLSADELSALQSLDHAEYSYDAKLKQTTAKTSTTYQQKRTNQSEDINRRHARLITNVPNEFEIEQKSFPLEPFDNSLRRSQRLHEIRKNLRTKYDDQTKTEQPVNILVERINPSNDRKYRSRTVEVNAVDNQMYGSLSSKSKHQSQHRSISHKHRSDRLSFRRSSEDIQDKHLQLRRHLDSTNSNETWMEIGKEHWTNLLENGWRPTIGTSGVNLVTFTDSDNYGSCQKENPIIDLYEQVSRKEYMSLFDQLAFAYTRTIDLGNEFWRFLDINGNQHLCLYHQLNKQFIMYKPDNTLLSYPWPYDGIVDISWSQSTNRWVVATQTQIIICNHSFSKVLQSIDINGDWPKRITSCRSSIFHTYKIPPASIKSSYHRSSQKDHPQFLLERYDYKLNSVCKHILESSTIWDIEADDLTEHVAVLCDVALLIFDYQLNLLRQIEVTGFKVSTDHFGGWLIADYNTSCIWQIRRNEYLKAHKILQVERPWSVILEQNTWTLITLSETQNRAKRLLFFPMKNIPASLVQIDSSQSQISNSSSSSIAESLL